MTATGTTPELRTMEPGDVARVVELQRAFLQGSIVTELGPSFLTAFHRAALAHPATRAFVVIDAADVTGFAVASTDVTAFNAHVKPRVVWPLAQALVSPRGIRLGVGIARSLVEAKPEPYMAAELLLLVVDARLRRRGIGHRLVAALDAAFARDGVSDYRVAVRSQLVAARAFYLALGFRPEQELTVLGHPMTYLTKRVAG